MFSNFFLQKWDTPHKKLLLDSMTTTEHYGPLAISVRESLRYTGYTINGNVIAFLMQKSVTNSDGKVFMDYYKYPFDHTSSYPGQQAHDQLSECT
ncbi:MAG: hypothetical protein IPO37_23205 [Saprospiraceae bacterium]|nr:hypothetical protein [Saprospiraceae bacterium]